MAIVTKRSLLCFGHAMKRRLRPFLRNIARCVCAWRRICLESGRVLRNVSTTSICVCGNPFLPSDRDHSRPTPCGKCHRCRPHVGGLLSVSVRRAYRRIKLRPPPCGGLNFVRIIFHFPLPNAWGRGIIDLIHIPRKEGSRHETDRNIAKRYPLPLL